MTTSEGAARRSTPPPAPPTLDHAAELRAALTQTQLVFEGDRGAEQALDYLRVVLNADPATAAWLQGGQLPDQEQAPASTDAGAEPATPIVTKLSIDIDTSAIDAAMAKLEALKASAAEARVALDGLHDTAAPAPASPERAAVGGDCGLTQPTELAVLVMILAELRKAARERRQAGQLALYVTTPQDVKTARVPV